MKEYRCESCGFVYDPEQKINKGQYFKDIPDDYLCPACKGSKINFRAVGTEYRKVKDLFKKKRVGKGEK